MEIDVQNHILSIISRYGKFRIAIRLIANMFLKRQRLRRTLQKGIFTIYNYSSLG
jgi:hypothetical protein